MPPTPCVSCAPACAQASRMLRSALRWLRCWVGERPGHVVRCQQSHRARAAECARARGKQPLLKCTAHTHYALFVRSPRVSSRQHHELLRPLSFIHSRAQAVAPTAPSSRRATARQVRVRACLCVAPIRPCLRHTQLCTARLCTPTHPPDHHTHNTHTHTGDTVAIKVISITDSDAEDLERIHKEARSAARARAAAAAAAWPYAAACQLLARTTRAARRPPARQLASCAARTAAAPPNSSAQQHTHTTAATHTRHPPTDPVPRGLRPPQRRALPGQLQAA
jgi:hypothetical protein